MSNATDNKGKINNLSIKDRCNILQRLEDGMSGSQLATEFNVTRQAISAIKKRQKNILHAKKVLENCDGDISRKRYRATEESELDNKLFQWFQQGRSMGLAISGTILKKKALFYNMKLGGKENFTASDGWLDCFKKRHGLKQKTIEGEKLSANFDGSEEFKVKLNNIMKVTGIGLDFIYNCDETGLYWKAMPNKTLVGRGEKRAEGHKKPKNRLTIMLCSNASGSHKLPLLVIGKAAQPRCLKGIKNLPVRYMHQKNAWMSSDLMKEWYSSIFVSEVKQKHDLENNKELKIILIMDNAACHPPAEELNAICANCSIMYLPPNVTSLIQPLDQGIIVKFKRCYRNLMLENIQIEDNIQRGYNYLDSLNLLQCFQFCASAWNQLTPCDIRNCWKNLIPFENDNSSNLIIESMDTSEFQAILTNIGIYESLSVDDIEDWLNIDKEENGWQPHSDDEILSGKFLDINGNDVVKEEDDEVAHGDQESSSADSILDNDVGPTSIEAFLGIETFLNWYRRHGKNGELGQRCYEEAYQELSRVMISKK